MANPAGPPHTACGAGVPPPIFTCAAEMKSSILQRLQIARLQCGLTRSQQFQVRPRHWSGVSSTSLLSCGRRCTRSALAARRGIPPGWPLAPCPAPRTAVTTFTSATHGTCPSLFWRPQGRAQSQLEPDIARCMLGAGLPALEFSRDSHWTAHMQDRISTPSWMSSVDSVTQTICSTQAQT